MKKRIVIIALALLFAAGVAGLLLHGRSAHDAAADEDMVIISVAGKESMRVPLSKPQRLTIRQETGEVNVVEITRDGVQMVEANCRNQLCVHSGKVTKENWEIRPNQAFIVCLPNQVTVELVVKE